MIWGDDIGRSNISAYTHGLMGYQTPNIDRLAKEGMMFTDYYAENSCTAGRAAFITGQSVFRTGNSKVGLPGAKQGLNRKMHDCRAAKAIRLRDLAGRQEITLETATNTCPRYTASMNSMVFSIT